MKNFNMLAICVVMLVMLAFAYYWEAEMAFEKENPAFMGLYSEGFEYSRFASCNPLPTRENEEPIFEAYLTFSDYRETQRHFRKYFNGSYQPFYFKFRGKLIHHEESPPWQEYEVEVTEILAVDDQANRECTPPFNPGIPDEVWIEYVPKTEPPEEVFKRLKSEAFQKVE